MYHNVPVFIVISVHTNILCTFTILDNVLKFNVTHEKYNQDPLLGHGSQFGNLRIIHYRHYSIILLYIMYTFVSWKYYCNVTQYDVLQSVLISFASFSFSSNVFGINTGILIINYTHACVRIPEYLYIAVSR